MITFSNYLTEGGFKGFKDTDTAAQGGKTAGKNKQSAAGKKHQQAMIDAALKQDKKSFDKVAKQSATMRSKMIGTKVEPQKMWSIAKAKAMKDGSYFNMNLKQRQSI